ncbi:hypothetical protein NHG34_05240 [Aerococcaceae bacterium NML190938]|nr:hypothetical protein [Aerococcaceae bacterium NML190938]
MMSEMFGFDEAVLQFDAYASKTKKAKEALNEVADDMVRTAKAYATSAGLVRSGAGISGIVKETHGNDVTIGWSTRPGLHLYFHERGFHALDNRHRTWKLKRRGKRGKGYRDYRGVKATYIPPKPHMRPAFYKHEREFQDKVQNKIT